ncbi:hypothetical protein O3P69_003424 [Scylla paramamosain]|uniref:Uncharacterized protein n=1 Tax=Scylla paramamosain TaxID=85552 RepID=A0AAW0UJ70_SCYPA
MLFLAGIPVFFMELSIGQYISLGPAVLFPKLAPIFSGLGWGVVSIAFFTAIYFNVILAWSFFYMIFSFYSVLPWSHCDNEFNSPGCYYEEGAALCRNQSLFFFNQSCLSLEDYCGLADLIPFNQTHCQNYANTSLTSAEKVITKISAMAKVLHQGLGKKKRKVLEAVYINMNKNLHKRSGDVVWAGPAAALCTPKVTDR